MDHRTLNQILATLPEQIPDIIRMTRDCLNQDGSIDRNRINQLPEPALEAAVAQARRQAAQTQRLNEALATLAARRRN